MTKRILEILDNVRYWEACPDDYKRYIETFLEEQNQALSQHDVIKSVCNHDFGHFNQFTRCRKCGII